MGVNKELNKLMETHWTMTRNDSFHYGVDFSVCGSKKKQKIMYKSAKNAGKLMLFNIDCIIVDAFDYFFEVWIMNET